MGHPQSRRKPLRRRGVLLCLSFSAAQVQSFVKSFLLILFARKCESFLFYRLRDRHFNEHTVRLLDVPDALAFEGGDRLRAALASAFGDVSYTFTPFPFSGAVYCSFQRHQTKLLAVSKEWLEVDGGHIGYATRFCAKCLDF